MLAAGAGSFLLPAWWWWGLVASAAVWIGCMPKSSTICQEVRYVRFRALQDAVYAKQLSVWQAVCLIAQQVLFPVLFCGTLLFVLIVATQLGWRHLSWVILSLDTAFLLYLLLMVCLVSLFARGDDVQRYTTVRKWPQVAVGWLVVHAIITSVLLRCYRPVVQERWWIAHVMMTLVGSLLVQLGFELLAAEQ